MCNPHSITVHGKKVDRRGMWGLCGRGAEGCTQGFGWET